jgi:hypothetical protein
VGPLHFSVELWPVTFNARELYANVFNMPMELWLKFMAIVDPNFSNAEWKLFNDIANYVDRIGLRVSLIDPEGPDTGCIVNYDIEDPLYFLTTFPFEDQKCNIYLNVMACHLLLISLWYSAFAFVWLWAVD